MAKTEKILAREEVYARKAEQLLGKHAIPDFAWGSQFFDVSSGDSRESLTAAVSRWRDSPETFLDFRKFSKPQILDHTGDSFIELTSVLKNADRARLFYRRQPRRRSGYDKAVIIVPHWNARVEKYKRFTRLAQFLWLPISTFIYFPVYGGQVADGARGTVYEAVGPNVGQTLFRVWQDVLNLQAAAEYARTVLGFHKVGFYSFSTGSLRAFLAQLFTPDLFDYSVLHFVADDFTEAVTGGLSTQYIARVILKHMTPQELRELWSPLSPGSYVPYLDRLSGRTRLVQGKYDMAFGPNNVGRFTRKVRRAAPQIEIEEGEYGHYFTFWEMVQTLTMCKHDFSFIYRHVGLSYFG